jgi:hypothetical protein
VIKLPKGYTGPFLITTDDRLNSEPEGPVICDSIEHAYSQIGHFIMSLDVAPSDVRVWLLSDIAVTSIADYTIEGLPRPKDD